MASTHDLKVASYNIHGCIGADRCFDPDRVASVIGETGADIVAVQEVDARYHGEDYVDQWMLLGRATRLACIPGISLRTHRKTYGNAILTRLPVRSVRLHDITVPGREPRGVIDADIVVAGRVLRVIATHLGLGTAERRRQSRLLSRLLAGPCPDREGPGIAVRGEAFLGVVLLGDLNEWRPGAPSLRDVTRLCADAPSPRSFPARFPLFALDRILARGGIRLGAVGAHRSSLARLASDHLPVTGVLSW